jgi:hypothetical protein
MIFKHFRQSKMAILTQNTASLYKTVNFLKKKCSFLAEAWRKAPNIVIITLTPEL